MKSSACMKSITRKLDPHRKSPWLRTNRAEVQGLFSHDGEEVVSSTNSTLLRNASLLENITRSFRGEVKNTTIYWSSMYSTVPRFFGLCIVFTGLFNHSFIFYSSYQAFPFIIPRLETMPNDMCSYGNAKQHLIMSIFCVQSGPFPDQLDAVLDCIFMNI